MNWLKKVIPLNLNAEKEKFFQNNSYNPQFVYQEKKEKNRDLYKFGLPNKETLGLAQEIVNRAYHNRNYDDLHKLEGKKLSQPEVTQAFQQFIEEHGLEKDLKIIWSPSFVARATTHEGSIELRSTAEFRQQGLLGLIFHEVGTHAIRRFNYQKQPWYQKESEYGFGFYLQSEEGLASFHSLLPCSLKLAHSVALKYLAPYYAQNHSFVEVWNYLKNYITDREQLWMLTLRQKRGLEDTSQPGGPTKDISYFQGMLEAWDWLNKNDFDITKFYFGKMSFADTQKAYQLNPSFKPLLPSFFTKDRNKYASLIREIGQENQFKII